MTQLRLRLQEDILKFWFEYSIKAREMYDISCSSVKTRAVPVDIGTANCMGAI